MPNTTRKYPVSLDVPVTEELASAVKALAGRKNLSVPETVRRLLTQGVSRTAALDAVAPVEAAVRRVIREELRPEHDLIFKGAYQAALAAAMICHLDSRASKIEPEARKQAAAALRKRPDNDLEPLDPIDE